MTITKHELKQARNSWLIWTVSIAFLIAVCIFMYPEMSKEMDSFGDMFASMGSFSDAFGLDKLNFGTFIGFYAIECGNILGLGGAFFAAMIGAAALAKEEKDKTAEFLFAHPISRKRVITEKLVSVLIQILLVNVVVFGCSILSTQVAIGEIPWKEMWLMHGAYLLLHLELAGICFGISAFIIKGSLGIGMGLACLVYFLNLMANMTDKMKFLKWFTPFAYCEGADIISDGALDVKYIAAGMVVMIICLIAGYIHYTKKDLR